MGPHSLIYFVAFQPYCLGRTTTYSPDNAMNSYFCLFQPYFLGRRNSFEGLTSLAFLWLLLEPFSPHMWAWDFLGSRSRHMKKVTWDWIWLSWSSQLLQSGHTTKSIKILHHFILKIWMRGNDLSHSIRATIHIEIPFNNLWGDDNTVSPGRFRRIIVKQFIYFQNYVLTMKNSNGFPFSLWRQGFGDKRFQLFFYKP